MLKGNESGWKNFPPEDQISTSTCRYHIRLKGFTTQYLMYKYMNKKTFINLSLLFILTAVTRYIFRANFLYEWDSVQYALSIDKFDILWHQPHPPGYILYVAVIKFAHLFIPNANFAIIASNIFFSSITLIIFYLLCRLMLEDDRVVLMAAWLFAFNPVFWFSGSTAIIYSVEAFIAITAGFLLWISLRSPHLKYLALSLFILGLLAGFRQTAVLLLSPLILFVFFKKVKSIKFFFPLLALFLLGVLLWLLPTLHNTSGLEGYLATSRGLTADLSQKLDTAFGGTMNYLVTNLSNFSIWMLQGVSPQGLVLIVLSLILFLKNTTIKGFFTNNKVLFFILWVFPALVFYLVYTEKAGYLLSLFPPLIILFAWSIKRLSGLLNLKKQMLFQYGIFGFSLVLSILWFVWPSSQAGIPQKINFPSYIIQPAYSDYNWDVSYREIRLKNAVFKTFGDFLHSDPQYDNTHAVLFWTGGYPTWRHMMFYYPEYQTYWLIDESVSGVSQFGSEYYLAENYQIDSYSGLPFWVQGDRPNTIMISLSEDVEWLFWIVDPRTSFYTTLVKNGNVDRSFELPNGQLVLITPKSESPMDLGSFIFR
jgi:4-amino-4-deoxy-L-arabinose transferase-like glycosyltransferase